MNWGHTSASQIKTYKSCPRKWYRESILGERQPAGPAALRGQAIHAELEKYLEHGTLPDDGTARALARMLPEGGTIPAEQIEKEFLWTPPDWEVPAKGFVDLCLPPNEIIDHKSTASLNYALTEQEARRDPQALIYAGVAFAGALGVSFSNQTLRFRLNYATTRGAIKTRSVYVDLSPEEVLEGLDSIRSNVITQQYDLSTCNEAWDKIKPDYSACDKYGGCPFRQDCQRVVRPQIQEVLTVGNVNSFKEALERRKAQKQSKPISCETPEPIRPQRAELDILGSQYQTANPPDGLPDGATIAPQEHTKQKAPRYEGRTITSLKAPELKDAVRAVAKELTESQRSQVPNGVEPQGTKSDNQARLIAMLKIINNPQSEKKMASENTATDTQSIFWSIADTTAQEQKNTNLSTPAATSLHIPPAPVPPPQPSTAPAQETEETNRGYPPSWDTPKETYVLVDAHCTGAVELELCMRELIEEIENRYEMPISVIKYNEGWKELAALISSRGWFHCHLPEMVRIDSSSPLWVNCSHAIVPLASRVIRGTR